MQTQSWVSYPIPSGQRSFSAVLAYSAIDAPDSRAEFNRIRVRLLVDDKEVFRAHVDKDTPPEEFTVPLGQGKTLMIDSDAEFTEDRIYLVNPVFSPDTAPSSRSYVLPPGTGYVNVSPEPRQILFHVFRPGESVAAGAYFGGTGSSARVSVEVKPESGAQGASSAFTVPLSPGGTGAASGSFTWRVPTLRGPANVEVREDLNGKTVFQNSFRIAIAPEVDLSRVSDSPFGVHLSGHGFAYLFDEFASLWGAKWARVFVNWPLVEAQQGQYDFSRMDQLVDDYRRQGMQVMGVLGEHFPDWVATPGPAQYAAFGKFAELAVRRYSGKIQYWDVFNEVDVKYYALLRKATASGNEAEVADADIEWLRAGLNAVHRVGGKTVCCSTGTSLWLPWDLRVFKAGFLEDIDVASLHPYMHEVPPEVKDGAYDFPGKVQALQNLIQRFNISKPIWSTETNYILGALGSPEVSAPDLDEHTQAEFDVRANLLAYSMGVKYFLHAPFFYPARRELHLDTLAAYANMASLFSGASRLPALSFGTNDIYAVVGQSGGGLVGAIWTPLSSARVSLSGVNGVQFMDLYGNPILQSSNNLQISGSPIYFRSTSFASPSIGLIEEAPQSPWQPLQPIATWKRSSNSVYQRRGDMIHVVSSRPVLDGHALDSALISVNPDSCYVFRLPARVLRGAIEMEVKDAATGKPIDSSARVWLHAIGETKPLDMQLSVRTRSASDVQLVISNDNAVPDISEFEVGDPEFRPCLVGSPR
ncbi:MAG: endo-1,4-beta-xylanase [Terriglobia bacterium]